MSWEAVFPSTGGSSGLAFSQSWVCTTIATSLGSEQWYLLFWLFVFWSWLKKFIITLENDVVWIGWFSSGAQSFWHSCTSSFLYWLAFVNKNSLLTLIYTRDTQLSNECRQTFLWQALYLITWPKNCPNLSSAPCRMEIQSVMVVFSTPLVKYCPSNLLTGSPPPPVPVWISTGICIYTVCNRGWRGSGCVESIYRSYTLCIWPDSKPTKLLYHPKQKTNKEGRGPQTDKHLPPSPFTGQYIRKVDI